MNENTIWKFAMCGNLVFGRGAVAQCGVLARQVSSTRVLIVTDRNLVELGFAQRVCQALKEAGLHSIVFDGGQPEPGISIVMAADEYGRSNDCDSVVGLGGGSNIDVAKMTSVTLKHGGTPKDYFGFDRIPGRPLPIIAIPTTAGTGSEVSHSSVLTDAEQQIKVSSLSRWLRPTSAIVDPELTDSCPSIVTAHSGIDALVHAIEAYTARPFSKMVDVDPQARAYEGAHPFGDMVAGEAIRRIGHCLVKAVHQGTDREARDSMALAASLAGMAFSNCGVAVVHALEYPIGVAVHCSHGEGNGLLLPHVMRFNLATSFERFADIAHWLGYQPQPAESIESQAHAAINLVEKLLQSIGIRRRLRDLGVQRQQLSQFAEKAYSIKRLMVLNPRTPSLEDLSNILEAAF